MPNTYTQIYIQFVFAVHSRDNLISAEWRDELYHYIAGIVRKRQNLVLAIGGVENHIHMLVGMNPVASPSALMADVKRSSSKWINDKGLTPGHFAWQEGFGAFSYAQSQIDKVKRYIGNQEEHHRRKTFREEYIAFLRAYGVQYDEKYILRDV